MEDIAGRLGEHGITIELTDSARTWLAEQGFDPAFGARPLKRLLQKYVESPLSVKLLKGEFGSGDTVKVDVDKDNAVVFELKNKGSAKKSSAKVETDA